MIIILLTLLGCMVLGIVVSGQWVGISFGAGGGDEDDKLWTYRMGPVDGWLRLTYLCGETYDVDDEAPPQGHWWGGFTKAGPPGEQDWQFDLPAWEPLILLLFYPVSALIRGVLLHLRRGPIAEQMVDAPAPEPQRGRLRRAGWLKTAFLTIMLFLVVSTTILTISSWWVTTGFEIGGKPHHGAPVERESFWFRVWLSAGWFDAGLTVGPATGNFATVVDWYGGFANYSTTNYRYYQAYIPFWEIAGPLALYPVVQLTLLGARGVRRRRRRLRGLCVQCGYNLTGNVSGTCPECGHALEAENS
jgi:hypothetical protein